LYNGSERAIRNFKIKLKVSGFFKSPQGAETFAMIKSVIDTAIKNNRNPLLLLSSLLNEMALNSDKYFNIISNPTFTL
jgi:transposase